MVKIQKATSRGQITLPKAWRDQTNTQYFKIIVKEEELVIRPLPQKSFEEEVEDSFKEYQDGKYTDYADLKGKYGL